MNYLKSNAMPLAIGFAVGYFIAKKGGLGMVTAKAKSAVA
jgi:hypothetical protein